jgi:glycosyltransferase involved in cell wall biosynthesis
VNNKILFILHFPPPVHGSAVIGGLIKDSVAINRQFECRYINLGISVTVEEIGKGSLKKLLRYLSTLWLVVKELTTFRPGLCYMTPNAAGTALYKEVIIIGLVKLFRKKLIYHLHNKGVSARQGKSFDNIIYRFVFKDVFVILLSPLLYPDIQKYVPEEHVYYCPNGIPSLNINDSPAPVTQELVSGNQYPTPVEILFLSNLFESKGVFVLLDACKILKERGLIFHCTIAGEEGDLTLQDVNEEIKKKDIESFIDLTGGRYEKDKDKSLRTADIFCFPTFYHKECMPLVLLEAMQYSLPVVSTFEGAIPDIIVDGLTGFLVKQKDEIGLADKLDAMIKDPLMRYKIGMAGKEKFIGEFTIDKFENRLYKILKKTIN